MKQQMLLLIISMLLPITIHAQDTWLTIIVHGALGLGANLSSKTINLIKKDCIEGSSYERNVTTIRENPYMFALSPTGKLGLHKVTPSTNTTDAAYIFSELYTILDTRYNGPRNNTFYTYGWSGLMSTKRCKQAAREFYRALKELIVQETKKGSTPKIRIIGYSYGPIMFLNFAHLRDEYKNDTFMIDETILVGTPINKTMGPLIAKPPFKKVYHIYSRGDKLQRLDMFSGSHLMSHRCFKGVFPHLTQIEFKLTAHLRRLPNQTLPANMKRCITQSPGHVEFWSFGWANSYYRKNLYMYPLPGAVFIPYLIHAASQVDANHVQVVIRPEQELAKVHSHLCHQCKTIPFMSQQEFKKLTNKALQYHPEKEPYKTALREHKKTIGNYK